MVTPMARVSDSVVAGGCLRTGSCRECAVDTYFVLASPQAQHAVLVFRLLAIVALVRGHGLKSVRSGGCCDEILKRRDTTIAEGLAVSETLPIAAARIPKPGEKPTPFCATAGQTWQVQACGVLRRVIPSDEVEG